MNFLAHLYLSGKSEPVMVGNFIGDYVKGRQYSEYPPEIQTGILLHRQIDFFTDSHPLVKECNALLQPIYRKYAGIVTDLYFDHFLAKNWSDYSSQSLASYTKEVHAVLLKNFLILPSRVKQFLPFLIQNKRLRSYAEVEGIIEALRIMSRHSSLPAESQFAEQILKNNYPFLQEKFHLFFAELISFSKNYLHNNEIVKTTGIQHI